MDAEHQSDTRNRNGTDRGERRRKEGSGEEDRHGVTVVNLMGAPGAGKTALLERLLEDPLPGIRIGIRSVATG